MIDSDWRQDDTVGWSWIYEFGYDTFCHEDIQCIEQQVAAITMGWTDH